LINNDLLINYLAASIVVLFVATAIVPTGVGDNQKPSSLINSITNENTSQFFSNGGLMNSSWPMFCHDIHHKGQSPYSTKNNSGIIKWSFKTNNYPLYGSPAIDTNGTIYIGSGDFFALYPNGTKKWEYAITSGLFDSCPAIDKNGIIYIGTAMGSPTYFYAIYPNGSLKWRYRSGNIFSSPVISYDGNIIFADADNWNIIALCPNGTQKWSYHTDMVVYSSPAIGLDGTIYCGCHDTYLYALYPNNGTLKWKFKTGDWIRVSPCIADDGTIYCVSTDGYLYAIDPNGTKKWRTWVEAGTSPTIGQDGTIYAGWSKLYAVNPTNGSIKWIFDTGGCIQGGTPCTSKEGTIYFGTSSGGYLITLNPNGTERFRIHIGSCESAPAIGIDGTIYIGSMDNNDRGYLWAFNGGPLSAEANGPYTGRIGIPIQFTGVASGGILQYTYHWDFGDGNISDEQNPMYTYTRKGNYTATFSVTDSDHNNSYDTANVTIDYALPTVEILKPENGVYLFNMKVLPFHQPIIIGRITVEVNAVHDELGIDRVEFYVDDDLQSTDTAEPYEWLWADRVFFKHTVVAVAYDTSGRTNSDTVSVWKFF